MMLAFFMDALSVAWDATNIAALAHCDAVRRGHPLHQRHCGSPRMCATRHCDARHHIVVGHHRGGFSPPAAVMTATIMSPVATRRTPALTPKVLSIVNSSTRNSAPPQTPGTFALPPDTDVPPMTTTAIEAKRYSL